jgi:SAM-dependent methyltransferase
MRQLLRRNRAETAAPEPALPDPLQLARVDALVAPLTDREDRAVQHRGGPVSTALYERMSAEDVAAVVAALEGSTRVNWDRASEAERVILAPIFAAVYDITSALDHTGLVRAEPPEHVHAMARGPLAHAGEPVLGDLVVRAFEEAGCGLPSDGRVLDFGCSSGRVVRVLGAYRPDLEWLGCDPNADAIAWASEHLPMARFVVSPTVPPLELGDGSIDRAYAISIWSHFSRSAALAWLVEMHRVVKPGGALLLTTHGLDTVAYQLRHDLMTRDSAAETTGALLRDGTQFFSIFGDDGDWGVKDPGWGTGYLAADWLAAHVTPDWAVRLFRPGMLDGNQDVFVLERRP